MATNREVLTAVGEATGVDPESLFPHLGIGQQAQDFMSDNSAVLGGIGAGVGAIGSAVGSGLRGMAASNLQQELSQAETAKQMEFARERIGIEQEQATESLEFDKERASFASRLADFNEDIRRAERTRRKFQGFLDRNNKADESRKLTEETRKVLERARL